ncbi:hypothetical protein VE02_03764 [Pseudogymnoascus sp. 03VT05]|nr:hypothetical protein VE02_03764 [Pseudogymnoascus sp. 03VT05]
MKLSTLLPAALLAAAPALACLETSGSIDLAGNVGRITAVDNGVLVCDSDKGHRIGQDGHISVTCKAGYVYAVTKDGSMRWYKNPTNAFSFKQVVGGSHQTWTGMRRDMGASSGEGGMECQKSWYNYRSGQMAGIGPVWIYLLVLLAIKGRRTELDGMGL